MFASERPRPAERPSAGSGSISLGTPPTFDARSASVAGGSARGFGARVKTAARRAAAAARAASRPRPCRRGWTARPRCPRARTRASAAIPGALCAPSKIVSGSWSTTCSRPGTARPRSAQSSSARAEHGARRRRRPRREVRALVAGQVDLDWLGPHDRARRSLGQRDARRACSSPSTNVAPSAHHGELLARDVGDRRAEPARVLEPDVREHDDLGAEHVGRVVAAAEARLDHGDLDPAARELVERGRGQQLELGYALAVGRGPVDLRRPRRPRAGSPRRTRRRSGRRRRPDALGERRQVRRQVGAGAHAVRLQQRGGEAHGRATCRWCRRRARRGSAPAGEPSAVSSRRMRSRPKRMPNSSSESRCSSASAEVPRCS